MQRQSDDSSLALRDSSSGRGSEGRCADELDEARSPPSPYYAECAFRCDLTKHEILYHRVKWSLEKAVALGRADILERNQDIWKNVVPKENLIDLASEKGHLKVVQGDKALSPSDPLRLAVGVSRLPLQIHVNLYTIVKIFR